MISKQDYDVVSTTQNTDLGAQATTGDGRYFRYVYNNGTVLVPGNLIQTSAESTSNLEKLSASATTVGATTITLTSSVTISSNLLSGGYASVASGTGIGYTYKVLSNTGVTSAAGCVITLEDPIVIATASGSTWNFTVNPYANVIQNPSSATGACLGVAISPIAGSSYGWIQSRGPVGALSDATLAAVGKGITPSFTTAGAFTAAAGTTTSVAVIGLSMQTQTSAQVGFVYLTLD